ncbi:hypothetical protein JR316_0004215 [Psilocybe cubensis]|uniref:Uncharacterized protein n=2 Tax=Psilocybe cubensis TaxID=181762 RepID=A0ACB8H4K8_PSICU|nr:hypothetical protein JR316_0004215 [Psilocybe cubensis]KAH9482120.1 hypothetical protein JR316_0004215 [Psilocybe cubensis]
MTTNAVASSSKQPSAPAAPKPKRPPHNISGKNQYKDRPLLDDPHVAELLNAYHLKGITDNRLISNLLLEEHGVTLGERSVYRRKKMLGLWASKHTTKELSEAVKRQLVAAQMAKDPTGKLGARLVKQRVFEDTGLHLTRDYIRAEMRRVDPVAHAARGPSHILSKRLQRPAVSENASTSTSTSVPSNTITSNLVQSSNATIIPSGAQGQSQGSNAVDANQQSSTPRVRAPRRSRARATEASSLPTAVAPSDAAASTSSPPQSYTRNEPGIPSGNPLSSTSQTLHTFHSRSAYPSSYNAQVANSSTSDGQQVLHSQQLLQISTTLPQPSSSSLQDALNATESGYNHWPNSFDSEDGQFSPTGPGLLPNESSHTAGMPNITGTRPQTPRAYPEPSHHLSIPPVGTTQRNMDTGNRPAVMKDIARAVQESTPKMHELKHFIESLQLEDDGLSEDVDAETYDIILKGMETAALLERQLSKVVALARRSRLPVDRDVA